MILVGRISVFLLLDIFWDLSGTIKPCPTYMASLFHRTIPFHSDQERVCVAFDVKPAPLLLA